MLLGRSWQNATSVPEGQKNNKLLVRWTTNERKTSTHVAANFSAVCRCNLDEDRRRVLRVDVVRRMLQQPQKHHLGLGPLKLVSFSYKTSLLYKTVCRALKKEQNRTQPKNVATVMHCNLKRARRRASYSIV